MVAYTAPTGYHMHVAKAHTHHVHATPSARIQIACTHSVLWSLLVVFPIGLDKFVLPKLAVQVLVALVGIGAAATNGSLRWSRSLTALMCLIAVLTLSSLISASPATALLGSPARRMGIASWLLLAMMFALGSAYGRVRDIGSLVWSTIGVGSIVAIVTVFQAATSSTGIRPTSTLGTATATGMVLAVTLVLTAGALLRNDPRLRAALALAVILQLSALLLSGARGAWLGAAAGLAAATFPFWKLLSRARRGAAIAVAAVALTTLIVVLPGVGARTNTLLSPHEGTAGGRIALLDMGASAFADRPLLGWGADLGRLALHSHIPKGFEARYGDERVEDRVHNVVVDVALWGGALGVIALGWFVAAVARGLRSERSRWASRILSGAAIAYAVHLLFNFPSPDSDAALWLLVGAAVPTSSTRLRIPAWSAALAASCLGLALLPSLVDGLEAEIRMNSGADAEQRGDVGIAQRDYRAAVAAHASARTLEVLSRFELRVGHLDLALEAATAAMEHDHSDPYLAELRTAALAAYAQQKGDEALAHEAIAVARKLVAESPWDGSLHLVLGNACTAANDMACALDEYRRATDITPSRSEAWHNLGVVQLATDQPEAARASLQRALDLDPTNQKARDQLAAISEG